MDKKKKKRGESNYGVRVVARTPWLYALPSTNLLSFYNLELLWRFRFRPIDLGHVLTLPWTSASLNHQRALQPLPNLRGQFCPEVQFYHTIVNSQKLNGWTNDTCRVYVQSVSFLGVKSRVHRGFIKIRKSNGWNLRALNSLIKSWDPVKPAPHFPRNYILF